MSCMAEDSNRLVFSLIIKTGSVLMLETFINMTGNRLLPIVTVRELVEAMGKGSEQFVRLILQHASSVETSPSTSMMNMPNGVDVSMLRLIHEEFKIGHRHNFVWKVALSSCIRCNMMESVQYILEDRNPPLIYLNGWDRAEYIQLLCDICTFGHIEHFQAMISQRPELIS
ncbi:hypothetical protein SAMD00019534_113470 [Acytostelium subglobosum LB1]|uniref:hypothetical protein n=1 Tax=Acytostelium subglobosum LB1 TaxID=1410327 RepID=UPI000644A05E|nr:hypothetical protein SAMD00019534_113470 [Acytostelium subglobosum LB1]GAM28171.1 hypothetical protein SAMD00019534_113470 [Acytostelium subglobosum LB1]|eukprot:XP_012748805.1 hypothetical protein SAMD00019534_113470 [Acytostelium subglobosum LB1]